MNRLDIVGRIGKDPEIRYSKDGKAIANFSVAVKGYGNHTDWIPCVAFGKTAELIEKYFHSGSRIGISGSWNTGSYENKEGKKVTTHNCNVASIDFIDTKAESNYSDTPPMPSTSTNDGSDFMNISDSEMEELPFS